MKTGTKRWSVTASAIVGVFLALPVIAEAGPGPCAASFHFAVANQANASVFPSTVHTGCTAGVPSGAATMCIGNTAGSPGMNTFIAFWVNTVARTGDATGGCSFMCTSGDCRVGNDGLPVELLDFGVE